MQHCQIAEECTSRTTTLARDSSCMTSTRVHERRVQTWDISRVLLCKLKTSVLHTENNTHVLVNLLRAGKGIWFSITKKKKKVRKT